MYNKILGLNLKRKDIAFRLGISDSALKWQMEKTGFGMRSKYTAISYTLLRSFIQEIAGENPELGKMFALLCMSNDIFIR